MPSTKPTVVENIQVLQVGKYGVRVDEKTWFGVNEPLTPSHFVPNEGYKVSVTVSKTGKKYINEIIGTEQKVSAPAQAAAPAASAPVAAAPKAEEKAPAPATTTKSTNPSRAGFGQPLTDYDLQVQRQINRSSNWNAAMNSNFLGQFSTNPDEYLALVRKAADAGIKYTNE